MKFTKNSKILMDFFFHNKCINHVPLTNKTKQILQKIFHEFQNAHEYLENKKKKEELLFYKMNITKISTIRQIPKPTQFNANSFPAIVREHIDEYIEYTLSYTFSLFEREITIHFMVEEEDVELHIDKYNAYVEKIFMWLYFVNDYASKKCAKKLTLYLYLISLTKELPESNISILDQNHVNTAFTYTCPVVSEIVVFRKEEWFKVLMHETFHNFALDFSDMNNNNCHNKILSIFPVESEVNLYEAYTEFWAEILNATFFSYFSLHNKQNVQEFLETCEYFINFERTYSFFQLAKALRFMGLVYKDLYLPSSHIERKTLYKENSNVLAYYIIKTILLNNYQGFFEWCSKNNLSLLQFKKTVGNLDQLCLFIERNYKTKSMLYGVKCAEDMYFDKKKITGKKMKFIWNNMRMSICEMG